MEKTVFEARLLARRTWRRIWPFRVRLVIGAIVILVAAYVLLVWQGAAWLDSVRLRDLTPVQQESAVDAIRGRLIQIGAGVVAVVALVYTGFNYRLSREGHVTDRFTKAIEQLGSERLDVRLGGIYALERIMADSARDHATIVEVLAAFVREHSPAPRPGEVEHAKPSTTDIRAAFTVLGRRPTGREERGRLDLKWTNLSGVQLHHPDLSGADLNGAILAQAELGDARMTETDLMQANLYDVFLADADLRFANLVKAGMRGVCLKRANLTNACLARADLTGADLTEANLCNAVLAGANLTGADLTNADLANADLTDANLTGEQRAAATGLSGGGA